MTRKRDQTVNSSWARGKAQTGERTIALLWRGADGILRVRAVAASGSGSGATFRFLDTGELVTADEIRFMAASKRSSELASARAYHAREGGK